MKHKRKKSYNPFEMEGSYVGALLGGSIGFILASLPVVNPFWFFHIYPIFFIPIGLILGSLLGWGIHSLFRSLKR
jgi:hypothetical protein